MGSKTRMMGEAIKGTKSKKTTTKLEKPQVRQRKMVDCAQADTMARKMA